MNTAAPLVGLRYLVDSDGFIAIDHDTWPRRVGFRRSYLASRPRFVRWFRGHVTIRALNGTAAYRLEEEVDGVFLGSLVYAEGLGC